MIRIKELRGNEAFFIPGGFLDPLFCRIGKVSDTFRLSGIGSPFGDPINFYGLLKT